MTFIEYWHIGSSLALQEAIKYKPRRELRVVDTEFVMKFGVGTSFDSI